MKKDLKHGNLISPCYGCTADTGRSPTCHGVCEKYHIFLEKNEKVKENRKKDNFYVSVDIEHKKRRRR